MLRLHGVDDCLSLGHFLFIYQAIVAAITGADLIMRIQYIQVNEYMRNKIILVVRHLCVVYDGSFLRAIITAQSATDPAVMLPSKQRKLEATQQTRSAGTAILSGTGHLFMATLTKVIQSAGQQVHYYFQR